MKVDHLLFTVPDLDAGIEEAGRLLGVEPTRGGRHPDLGTANALIGMGPDSYLEIIGPDPERDHGTDLTILGMDFTTPRLGTWVAKAKLTGRLAARLPAVFGAVRPGQRLTPEGERLSWLFTDPFEPRYGGVVPCLIDWTDTAHPGSTLEPLCRLVDLRLEHPTPRLVEEAVGEFGGGLSVVRGDRPRVVAEIATPLGVVELS